MFPGWLVLLAFGLTTLTLFGAGQMARVREATLDRALIVNLIWWGLALLIGAWWHRGPEESLWIVVVLLYFLRLCLIRWGFGLRWRKALDVFVREWILQQLVWFLLAWLIGPRSMGLWRIPPDLLLLVVALFVGVLLLVYAGVLLGRAPRGTAKQQRRQEEQMDAWVRQARVDLRRGREDRERTLALMEEMTRRLERILESLREREQTPPPRPPEEEEAGENPGI
jgi:hypothetical protein